MTYHYPIETWPEVWLDNEAQYEEAKSYLESTVLKPVSSDHDWLCKQCGETNYSSFELCWNCGHEAKTD